MPLSEIRLFLWKVLSQDDCVEAVGTRMRFLHSQNAFTVWEPAATSPSSTVFLKHTLCVWGVGRHYFSSFESSMNYILVLSILSRKILPICITCLESIYYTMESYSHWFATSNIWVALTQICGLLLFFTSWSLFFSRIHCRCLSPL